MIYTNEEMNLITLCSFAELSYKTQFLLLGNLKTSEPDFIKNQRELIKTHGDGVYNKVKDNFYNHAYRTRVLKELDRRGITCVTYFSESYPPLLKEIPLPPTVLFCKGNTELLKTRCFSVVGSRRTTPPAIAECKKICSQLTQHFTVVTGTADGADSAAINGALPSGKLIAVLAYGFDYCYPSVNEGLLKKVEENGLLISEFIPTTKPAQYLFPVRNRVIAGMSEATLVVSAAKRSGALITANYATEYGRTTFAFPYSLGVVSGEGCNALIKKGGLLTENILDIFGLFGLDFKEAKSQVLSETERAVVEIIREEGEGFVPEIAAKLGKMPFELIPVLSALEIKGLIVRLGGNRYSAL